MDNNWEKAMDSLTQITVTSNLNNDPVTIHGEADDLRCIGVGTDAAVFQSFKSPAYAFKIYAEDKVSKIKVEEHVYNVLEDSPFFSTCYGSYYNCLILNYEEGTTFFDSLLQGVHIPRQAINDVEEAREYVRKRGLNPRDIHLKNILLQGGRAKILDISEYVKPGNDHRWEHLKKAYDEYYYLIDEKPIPFWLLETIRKWYNHWTKYYSSYEEFMKMVMNHTVFKR